MISNEGWARAVILWWQEIRVRPWPSPLIINIVISSYSSKCCHHHDQGEKDCEIMWNSETEADRGREGEGGQMVSGSWLGKAAHAHHWSVKPPADTIWHYLTLCHIVWQYLTLWDTIWHTVTHCDTVWHHLTLCDTCLTPYDNLWHMFDTIWHCVSLCDII